MQPKGQMSLMIRATSLRLIPTHGYLMRYGLFTCHIYCLVISSSELAGQAAFASLLLCVHFTCRPICSGSMAGLLIRAVSAVEQERAQLKERERAMQEAEQARKRAVRVTIDLLGRQVLFMTRARAHACQISHQDLAWSAFIQHSCRYPSKP